LGEFEFQDIVRAFSTDFTEGLVCEDDLPVFDDDHTLIDMLNDSAVANVAITESYFFCIGHRFVFCHHFSRILR
jgi:hypothetical protein